MSKTHRRRHHTLRLRQKWASLLKALDPQRDLKCITFGKIFSSDPIDCGNPKCILCSYSKILQRKEKRASRREEERNAWKSLD